MKTTVAAVISWIHFNVIFIWWSINSLQNIYQLKYYPGDLQDYIFTPILLEIALSDVEHVPGDDNTRSDNIDQCKIHGRWLELGGKLGLYCPLLFSVFPRQVWIRRGVSGGDSLILNKTLVGEPINDISGIRDTELWFVLRHPDPVASGVRRWLQPDLVQGEGERPSGREYVMIIMVIMNKTWIKWGHFAHWSIPDYTDMTFTL